MATRRVKPREWWLVVVPGRNYALMFGDERVASGVCEATNEEARYANQRGTVVRVREVRR